MDLELLLASLVFIVPMCLHRDPIMFSALPTDQDLGSKQRSDIWYGCGMVSLGLLIGAATAIIERYGCI